MKKIFFLGLIVLCTSCASHYQRAPRPNLPVNIESLRQNNINPSSLTGAYVSFTSPATFWKNSSDERYEDVQGGVYIQQDILSGQSLFVPMTLPVRYYKGPKKGEVVILSNGKTEYDFFLGEFVGSELSKDDITAERFWVQIGEDSESIILPFVREDIGRDPNLTSSGLQRVNKGTMNHGTLYRIEPFKITQPFSQADIQLWESQGFQTNGLLVWKNQQGTKYYLFNDIMGQGWLADEYTLQNFALSMTHFVKDKKDEREKTVPDTKRVGQ